MITKKAWHLQNYSMYFHKKLYYQNQDIAWANFDLVQVLGSQNQEAKYRVLPVAPYVLKKKDPNILMTTSLFQKEL